VSVVPQGGGAPKLLKATKVIVAVGGAPAPLPVPGGELAITSDGFFDLEARPKKVAVLGAGYIAVEMAGIFHGLGSECHLFFRGATVLRTFEPYIVETLMEEMAAHGPNLHPKSTPARLYRAADGTITVCVTDAIGMVVEHHGFDVVLSATGRLPVSPALHLERAGVTVNAKGLIEVDEYENTSAPSVYALGDVTTTGWELTPVAIAAGRRLADRLFGGEPRARIEYHTIATVVFSHPPIGTIGLTEPEARKAYGDAAIKTKQARFVPMIYSLNKKAEEGGYRVKTALKLVLKGPEERVVGLHCIGTHCDEMMQGFAVAVRMGATRADFEASVAIHPTIGEEFVTFGGWGQETDAAGKAKPKLPPYVDGSPFNVWGTMSAMSAAVSTAVSSIFSKVPVLTSK